MVDTIIGEDDKEAVEFVLKRCGIPGLSPAARLIGFRDKIGIRGAFLTDRYTGKGGSIHINWAGRNAHWLRPYMLTLVGMYVFDQLQCKIMYGEVHSTNLAVRNIDERLGFVEVATLKGYYPNDDLVIYAVEKNNFAWLPDEFKEAS